MIRRVIAGMGANSFGMAVTIGIQLASLPLFLHYWDTASYGIWLMLSAIPAYLSMAMGKGDAREANRVFQSVQMFMGIVCAGLAYRAITNQLNTKTASP